MTQQQLEDTLIGQNKILSYLQSISIVNFRKTFVPVIRSLSGSGLNGATICTSSGTIEVSVNATGKGSHLLQPVVVSANPTWVVGDRITIRLLLKENIPNIIENLKFSLLLGNVDTLLPAKAAVFHDTSSNTPTDFIEVLFDYPVRSLTDVLNIKIEIKNRAIGVSDAELYTWNSTEVFNNVMDQGLGYIFPQWFGAKGDDITDDSAAFQQAVDAATSSGKTLFVPQGIYKIGSQLKIGNGGNLKGKLTILGTGEASILRNAVTNSTVKTLFKLFQNQPVHFDNFKIQGTAGSGYTSHLVIDFNTDSVINKGSRFIRLTIDGPGYPFSLINCEDVLISDCYLNSSSSYNILYGTGGKAATVKGLTIRKCIFSGSSVIIGNDSPLINHIYAESGQNFNSEDNEFTGAPNLENTILINLQVPCSNVNVIRNKFGYCKNSSLKIRANPTLTVSNSIENVLVSNNSFLDTNKNSTDYDIKIGTASGSGSIKNVTIQNNNILNKFTAIYLERVENIIVTDNVIQSVEGAQLKDIEIINCLGPVFDDGNVRTKPNRVNSYNGKFMKTLTESVTSGNWLTVLTQTIELEKSSSYAIGANIKVTGGMNYSASGIISTGETLMSTESISLIFNAMSTGMGTKSVEWRWQGTSNNPEMQFRIIGDTSTLSLSISINYRKLM